MPEFLFVFGFETPPQRRNNTLMGWDDENSHGVLIEAPNEAAAFAWGEKVAQAYISLLHAPAPIDWLSERFAHWVHRDIGDEEWRRIRVGEFPDFEPWLKRDRD